MCQRIFIIKQSSYTTTLLLVGTRGGERVPCRTAQWLEQVWPCGVGGACRQLGARPPGTAGSGEKLSQPGRSHRTGFLSVFRWRAQSTRERGKSINRNQGGISKLCHFVSCPEVFGGCRSHIAPIFLRPLLSGLEVLVVLQTPFPMHYFYIKGTCTLKTLKSGRGF